MERKEFVSKTVIVTIVVSGISIVGSIIFNYFGISMNPFSLSEWVWIVITNLSVLLLYHNFIQEVIE